MALLRMIIVLGSLNVIADQNLVLEFLEVLKICQNKKDYKSKITYLRTLNINIIINSINLTFKLQNSYDLR